MTNALLAAAAAPSGSVDVLGDVVVVMATCVVFGLVARWLRQSVLVGYLLAGVLLGSQPWFGIVQDIDSFSFMGEVGVALLLFTVGLDLPLSKVRRMASTAVVAGGVQCLLTLSAAAAGAAALGLEPAAALVVGAAVAMSSTAVVMSVLADRSESDSVHGLVITGVLIAQDVIVVLVLLLMPLLPGAAGVTGSGGAVLGAVGLALAKLVGLVLVVAFVERIVMRSIFQREGVRQPRELLAVSSLTVSLGAIGACWALDLSPALGGFVAGIVMADAAYAVQVRSEIAPIRMGLMAIFFAYVGMLADAAWMLQHLGVILVGVAALIIGKALITWCAARLARVPQGAAVMSAAALAQLGEFSFAIMTLGVSVGLLEQEVFRLLVSVSLVSLLVTPACISWVSGWIQQRSLAAGASLDPDSAPTGALAQHAIVIGMGPAGRAVATALAGASVPVVVVELNPRPGGAPAELAGEDGQVHFCFGDASRPEILHRAGIERARILVVTIPDPVAIRTIIAQSRQLAPEVPVVARGRYNRYVADVQDAGADDVVDEEQVTGTELAQVALRRLVLAGDLDRRKGERRRGD